MKKIFTLLFAVGLFTMAQAQPGRGRTDVKIVVGSNPNYGNDFGNERRLKMEINSINREYDYKIQKVRNNFFHSRWEKQRLINQLENQREREIRMAYAKFKNNRYDRDYPRNRRY